MSNTWRARGDRTGEDVRKEERCWKRKKRKGYEDGEERGGDVMEKGGKSDEKERREEETIS